MLPPSWSLVPLSWSLVPLWSLLAQVWVVLVLGQLKGVEMPKQQRCVNQIKTRIIQDLEQIRAL